MINDSPKTAIILHGTGNSPQDNWFKWLDTKLRQIGFDVWTPSLPNPNLPDPKNVIPFIQHNCPFDITDNTALIGHSSGAVEILHLLPTLNTQVKLALLVGCFKDNDFLKYPANNNLFSIPLDLAHCREKCQDFIYVHSENDPFCPLNHVEFLKTGTGGCLIMLPGQKHFSISTMGSKYSQFPKLLEIIKSTYENSTSP